MAARATHLDVSILSIGSIDLLADTVGARLTLSSETAESKAIGRLGASPQVVKRTASLSVDLLNAKTLPNRVSHLDCSVFTLGGTSFLADLSNLSVTLGYSLESASAVADEWQFRQVVAKSISGSCDLKVPTASIPLLNSIDGAITTWSLDISFTLNGIAVTIPAIIESVEHGVAVDGIQTLSVKWAGRDPQTGDYPTAPTGTTTLLEKALNAPTTALAVEYETKAANGTNCTGSVVFTGGSFAIKDGEIVQNQYSFEFQGAPVNVLST